eukprot:scaffold133698_cov30-Tisochrysis_lutea.AAC.1
MSAQPTEITEMRMRMSRTTSQPASLNVYAAKVASVRLIGRDEQLSHLALSCFAHRPLRPARLSHILKVDALVVDCPRVEGFCDGLPQSVAVQKADAKRLLVLLGELRTHLLAEERMDGVGDTTCKADRAVRIGRQAPQPCVLNELEVLAKCAIDVTLRPEPWSGRHGAVAVLGVARGKAHEGCVVRLCVCVCVCRAARACAHRERPSVRVGHEKRESEAKRRHRNAWLAAVAVERSPSLPVCQGFLL